MRQKILKLATIGFAPGYRDVMLTLRCELGREHNVTLSPAEVQRLIDTLADAVAQRPQNKPPLDWRQYPQPIQWPAVKPYRPE
jgi:hypothetical protein